MLRIREAMLPFVEINILCLPEDTPTVRDVVTAFSVARCLDIDSTMVWNPKPRSGGLYKVKCHPHDVEHIRKFTNDLYNAHCPFDMDGVRKRLAAYDPPPRPFPTVDDIAK
jgi:hypothetical protein